MSIEQLPLDFTASATVRHRRARRAADDQPQLFAYQPNLDVHLHTSVEAVATVSGPEPERAVVWLSALVGQVRPVRSRRVAFSAAALDRLLHVLPPAQVTLDASASAVARGLWAAKLGLKPLRVSKSHGRLIASSPRWPSGFRVKDAPWTAIAALSQLGVPLDVDDAALALMNRRLSESGQTVATASLAGSAVLLETARPSLVEAWGLPALAYVGEPGSGRYRMPLLLAEPLTHNPLVRMSDELKAAIRKATARPRPLSPPAGFPWTLFPFQARDAGQALRILETTGGVLLAGDMGSGKTTVALALAAHQQTWPLLVVAPLMAFSTWARQLGEMGRSFYLATESPARSWAAIEDGAFDAVVVSYDRLHAFTELLERKHFAAVVADEIQRIRTPGSRRSRALRALAAAIPVRVGLSGTPVTNTVNDILPVGSFLAPSEWRPRANHRELEDLYPGDPLVAITDHLGSLMVRRRMCDTGQTLPDRRDHRVQVELTAEQRRALADLEAEAEAAKQAGEFEDGKAKWHAFQRLHRMRQIVNSPGQAGVGGGNPKVVAALDLAEDFLASGRKGVIFCADRAVFRDLSARLAADGVGHVGIWGSTPPAERIAAERRFHTDPGCQVVLATIQAASESVTFSPTATWLVTTAYMYTPSMLAQMEARIYRLNQTDPVDIVYLHASCPGGSLDDRMVEILEVKRELFARVVDRTVHTDSTEVHYSLEDLLYLITGRRDERVAAREGDARASVRREQDAKRHARVTAHRSRGRNRTSSEVADDRSTAATAAEWLASHGVAGDAEDLDALLVAEDLDEGAAADPV